MSTRSDTARTIAPAARVPDDLPPRCGGGAPDCLALPLLRSGGALSEAAVELFKLFGRKVGSVRPVCGFRQEFFLVDRERRDKRADLVLTGRTLVGAPPPKDRRGADPFAERVVSCMRDVSAEAAGLGVPAAGYCGGGAPGQYVFAPVYEAAELAVEHNLLLTEILTRVAARHNLACLLHEKPFAGVGGCGKSLNWSLWGDNDDNLFNPGDTAEENLFFLTLVASVVNAAHRHGGLLCAAAASAGNERRLGADNAPSAAVSVSLGGQLAKAVAALEAGKAEKGKKRDPADLGASLQFKLPPDADGGASPFAFTGAGFEFRMPGGPMNAATVVTVVNTIVAESIKTVCERVRKELSKAKGAQPPAAGKPNSSGGGITVDAASDADGAHGQDFAAAVISVLSAVIKESKTVLLEGVGGSGESAEEARGLHSAAPAYEALKAFAAPKAVELFGRYKVYSEAELLALRDDLLDQYEKTLDVEVKTLIDIVNTQILPAAYNYQADIASGLEVLRVLADDMTIEMTDGALEDRKEMFEALTADIYYVRKNLKELAALAGKARGLAAGERAAYMYTEVKPQMEHVRRHADALEASMPDEAWPLPKSREMLFII